MTILDAHTHFFSRPFFEALVAQQNPPGDPDAVLSEVAQKTGIEIPGPEVAAHTQKWLAQMDAHEVDKMVTFASLPQEADAVAKAMEESGGRLIGYGLVNPLVPEAPDFIARLSGLGFKGVLLFPVMHNYTANDPKIYPALEAIEAHGLLVCMHFGLLSVKLRDVLGLPRPYDLTFGNPLALQKTANTFIDTTFVIPHFGCGFFRETLMLGSQCENVMVDTSSSNSWMEVQPEALDLAGVFAKTKQVFGAERILFGTDSSTFPRGWRDDLVNAQKAAMEQAAFREEEVQLVLGANLRRLLSI